MKFSKRRLEFVDWALIVDVALLGLIGMLFGLDIIPHTGCEGLSRSLCTEFTYSGFWNVLYWLRPALLILGFVLLIVGLMRNTKSKR